MVDASAPKFVYVLFDVLHLERNNGALGPLPLQVSFKFQNYGV